MRLLDRLRDAIPEIAISTDVIVGFPGETAEDFDDTMTLAAQAQYQSMFSFKYSPRPNTLATKRMVDDVTEEEKTVRIVRLQALQREVQSGLHAGLVGRVVEVLVDTVSRRRDGELSGRTGSNVVVSFPPPVGSTEEAESAWVGRTAAVRVLRAGPHSVSGEFVPPLSIQDAPC